MILRGTKRTAAGLVAATLLSGCLAELPGGETGPFAPGNTVTYYYQSVLTDPPERAQIIECGDQFFSRACIRLSNNATFQLEPTETGGVAYGNETQRVVLQLDPGGVPSGLGQITDLTTGESRGMRWVSLPALRPAAAPSPES